MTSGSQKINEVDSISLTDSSAFKSVWSRLSHLFHSTEDNNRRLSTSSSESDSSNTSSSLKTESLSPRTRRHRAYHRKNRMLSKQLDNTDLSRPPVHLVLPPFSPTYCKANEFPYSNFYVKLPNGKWMIRYRSGNRDILGTDEFEGYMI
ncbi:hypothetical protein BD770DRAFT_391333 [Pilaira anomala]|nr:hypothetical protein BD770DRAFT_391333 [Pilaira anomala]